MQCLLGEDGEIRHQRLGSITNEEQTEQAEKKASLLSLRHIEILNLDFLFGLAFLRFFFDFLLFCGEVFMYIFLDKEE